MARKFSPPPKIAPLQIEGRLHPEWDKFFQQFLPMAGVLYLGPPDQEGTWRFIEDGNDLSIQRLEAGVWVQKGEFFA